MTINKDAAARVQAQPTPEDRAKEALKPVANVLEGRVFASPDLKDADWICPLVDKMLAAVTTAIREAEQAAYERGREDEREMCASICEQVATTRHETSQTGLSRHYGDIGEVAGRKCAELIAAAIRQRGDRDE